VEQVFALSSHFFVFHVEHRPLHRTPRALFHVEPLGGSELAFQRRPKRLGAQIFHVERSGFGPYFNYRSANVRLMDGSSCKCVPRGTPASPLASELHSSDPSRPCRHFLEAKFLHIANESR
jgi:hypothetical protein